MLANVRRLLERREADTSPNWDNPEANPRSRATLRSRAAGVTLTAGRAWGIRLYLLML
jgi:hypothetical protein